MTRKKLLLVPFLILLYFFIHFISDFWYFLEPVTVVKTSATYFSVVAILLFLGRRVFSNKKTFLLAFTTLLFLFLFYGSFIDTAVALKIQQPVNHINIRMILIFLAVCALIIFACSRLKESLVKRLLKFWAIYCLVLVLYDAGFFLLNTKPEKKYLTRPLIKQSFNPSQKPSVFFLLFDMYPSDTVLKRYLQFDNSVNASYLAGQGFYVTGNARSLYNETYLSLASTLNLQPLNFYDDKKIKEYKKPLIALKNTESALVPSLFKQAGYTFRNYSVFDISNQKSPLQFNLTYHLQNAFTGATFFNRCYDAFETDFFLANRNIDLNFLKTSWSNDVKADINFLTGSFDDLMKTFPETTPSFNYFHFMIPHPPILFDSAGNELPVKSRYAFNGFDSTNRRFTGYVQYGNHVMQKLINTIFEKAGKNVVIIIQGDHGYREFQSSFPDAIRYGVLNAVYLPDKNYSGFSDTISVLASFKQVLKNTFNYQP